NSLSLGIKLSKRVLCVGVSRSSSLTKEPCGLRRVLLHAGSAAVKDGKLLGGGNLAGSGCATEQIGRLSRIDRNTPAFEMHHGQCEECFAVALIGRQRIPGGGLFVIARHAIPSLMEKAEQCRRCAVAGFCPFQGMGEGGQ